MDNGNRGSSGPLNSSRSKSKRSSTNLANLRLTPLSSKYAHTTAAVEDAPKETPEVTFSNSHPSYLQGRSAPTTPGILSRSSSRRQLHGLRRTSIYDDEPTELKDDEPTDLARDGTRDGSLQVSNARLPKSKSEAALLVQRQRVMQKGGQVQPQSSRRHHSRRATGTNSPTISRSSTKIRDTEADWITRTGVAANVIVQQSKGQSWMTSKASNTSLAQVEDSTDDADDDDEGYEEMAAMSANTTRDSQVDGGDLTPVNTRVVGWGSRYGSRTGSRRTSRRGSFSGSRTTLGPLTNSDRTAQDLDEYVTTTMEPDFVDSDEDVPDHDDAAVSGIVGGKSFGFGGVVDRLMNLNLFKVEEREESTDDEWAHLGETDAQAAERMAADSKRKREEKERLLNRAVSGGEGEGAEPPEGGGWADVAWLVSVASKKIF